MLASKAAEAASFLEAVFGGCSVVEQARVVVWAKGRGSYPYTLERLSFAASRAVLLSEEGHGAYVGTCLYEEVKGPGRGRASNTVGAPGLWVDLDHQSTYRAKANLAPTIEDLYWILLNSEVSLPTLLVSTGAGLHGWWLFDKPVMFESAAQQAQFRTAVKELQNRLRCKAITRGWNVDETSDLSRVLRVPGTRNHKAGADVKLLDFQGKRIDWSLIENLSANALTTTITTNAVSVESVEPINPLSENETLIDRVIRSMRRTRDIIKLADVQTILSGSTLPEGRRNSSLQKITSMAAWYAFEAKPGVCADDIWPIFAPTVAAMEAQGNDPPSESEVKDMLRRSIEDVVLKRSRSVSLTKALGAAVRKNIATAVVTGGTQEFRERIQERTEEEQAEGYTDEDIAIFARSQNCTVEEFQKRWVIQCGSTYWIFSNGRYLTPVPQSSVENSVKQWLAPAPIQWLEPAKDGTFKKRKLVNVIQDVCTVALAVEGHLGLKESYYDSTTSTFHESICPLRDLTSQFFPEVDQWFRLLAGNQIEQFLDWLSGVVKLDHQMCALYLCGPPGVGKTFLASCLARLWTTGSPSELSSLSGSFNESISRCPLLFGDEFLPKAGFSRASMDIRALIGSSVRLLNRKYLATTTLHGAIRLILAGNNDQMLADKDTELTKEDLEAYASRILFLDARAEARDFLISQGDLSCWVQEDRIARHVLWLSENREVKRGKRFLVDGSITSMHMMLATLHPESARVCDWLAHYLDNPGPARTVLGTESPDILCGGGRLMVTTRAVLQTWDVYIRYGRPPSTTSVGRALANLSNSKQRMSIGSFNKSIYHDINIDLICEWAERAHFGNPASMRERIK